MEVLTIRPFGVTHAPFLNIQNVKTFFDHTDIEADLSQLDSLREAVQNLPITYGSLPVPTIQVQWSSQESRYRIIVSFKRGLSQVHSISGAIRKMPDRDESPLLKKLDSLAFSFGATTLRIIKEVYETSFPIHLASRVTWIKEIVENPVMMGASPSFFGRYFDYGLEECVKKFQEQFKILINAPRRLNRNRVVICSTIIKGGHEALAKTLKKILESRNFEVLLIYPDEPEIDSFEDIGITYKGKKITKAFVRNELTVGNADPIANSVFAQTDAYLERFYPGVYWEDTLQKIFEFAPAIIFSTAPQLYNQLLCISFFLGIPLNIFLSDYKIPTFFKDLKGTGMDLKIFVPTDDPTKLPIEILSDSDRFHPFESPLNKFSIDELHPIGNFADPLYFRSFSDSERIEIKARYSIGAEEKVILVTFGSVPNKDTLESVCQNLAKSSVQSSIGTPYKVIVVCGPNEDLIEIVQSVSPEFIVFPIVPQEVMADFFAIADSIIGKPGGGVTAQIEASGADLIGYAMYKWEIPNMYYLVQKGLGSIVSVIGGDEDLPALITASFQRTEERRRGGYARPLQLSDHIDEVLRVTLPQSEEPLTVRDPSEIASMRVESQAVHRNEPSAHQESLKPSRSDFVSYFIRKIARIIPDFIGNLLAKLIHYFK